MKIHRKISLVGIALILLGAGVLAPVLYFNQRSTSVAGLTPTTVEQTIIKPSAITGYPVKLSIPSLNMNLKVADGVYNEQTRTWTLSRDKVHYALMTAQPNNDNGNTLIYGHYRPEVFARLKAVQPGDKAIVITDNGYKFTYTFTSAKTVSPSDGSIFTYKGAPQLTLQTCTGVFMQNRQLFDFDFVSYEKT